MSYLIPQSLPQRSYGILRLALKTQLSTRSSTISLLPIIPSASISFKPSPSSSRPNPNERNKIQPQDRPLSRPFSPRPLKTPEELSSLQYLVRRTPSAQLPVYRKWMSGGTRQVILVKRIDGDRRKFLNDLTEALVVAKDSIRINPTTQHIEIRGDYFDKTRDWLLGQGF